MWYYEAAAMATLSSAIKKPPKTEIPKGLVHYLSIELIRLDVQFTRSPAISPTHVVACGEVTSCAAGHQEVSRCSTKDGSQGMCITFASERKLWNKAEPTPEKPRGDINRNPKQVTGVSVAPKRTCVGQKLLKKIIINDINHFYDVREVCYLL